MDKCGEVEDCEGKRLGMWGSGIRGTALMIDRERGKTS